MFEAASRMKLRFQSSRGNLSVEDLWDLPLATGAVNLNKLAMGINSELKAAGQESFVVTVKQTAAERQLTLKLDILKHIINVKLNEAQVAKEAKDRKDQRDKLLAALDRRNDRDLEGKSADELRKMIEALQ